jgi:hypothetical protein
MTARSRSSIKTEWQKGYLPPRINLIVPLAKSNTAQSLLHFVLLIPAMKE